VGLVIANGCFEIGLTDPCRKIRDERQALPAARRVFFVSSCKPRLVNQRLWGVRADTQVGPCGEIVG
jgi:hypothetical protein